MIPLVETERQPENYLRRSTLLILLGTVLAGYPTSIALIGQEKAIETGNVMLLALAVGIMVAYAKNAWEAVHEPYILGGDVLAIGIFLSWSGVALARGGSILWRILDQPVSWLNSGWWGMHIALTAMGGICHLVAPRAISGRVPTRQWIKIGIATAVSVFIAAALAIWTFDD